MEKNRKEKDWFQQLTDKRSTLAKQLKDPAAAGFWNSVVDKYSDEAHFLYELLQNSDDAQATEVHIRLHKDRLEYTHNGLVQFSISDPGRENDKEALGHLNAITSIGASNKQSGNSIGKFGIGFKSIFRYTDRPHIEDDNFSFDIQDFIVPVPAPRMSQERKAGETQFLFPLKHPATDYPDIEQKLETLHSPLFFLSHLKKIIWETDEGAHGSYKLVKEKETKIQSVAYSYITLTHETGGEQTVKRYHRYMDGCAVAFESNEAKEPQPLEEEENIFCFFPTKEQSPLPFVIHAPFLLTDNRESIKYHEAWNQQQVEKLGTLVATALTHLAQSNQLKDRIFDIIPLEKNKFLKKAGSTLLAPLYIAITEAMRTKALFYTDDGLYVDATHTRHTENKPLRELFCGEEEKLLPEKKKDLKWCFKSLYKEEEARQSLISNYLKENQLIASTIEMGDVLGTLTSTDIEVRGMEWLKKFYICLAKSKVTLGSQPVLLCADGKARALYSEGEGVSTKQIHAGSTNDSSDIHPLLWADERCRRALASLGIQEPGPQAEIEQQILPIYLNGRATLLPEEQTLRHLRRITECYQSLPPQGEERERFILRLKETPFIPVKDHSGNRCFQRAQQCILRTEQLHNYWEGHPERYFLDNQTIIDAIPPEERSTFYEILMRIGVTTTLSIETIRRTPLEAKRLGLELNPVSLRQYDNGDQEIMDKEISGWDHFIHHLTAERSAAFFNLLSEEIQRSTSFLFAQSLAGDYSYVEKGKQTRTRQRIAHTTARKVIFEEKWLFNKSGEKCTPQEIAETNQLSHIYDIANNDIFFFLGIKISDDLKGLTKEQKEAIDIVNKFKESGYTLRDMENLLAQIKAGKKLS